MITRRTKTRRNRRKYLYNNWDLYAMLAIPVVYIIVFKYVPMYGVQMAFRNFNIFKGMYNSPFVGFKHFETFIGSTEFTRLVGNTLTLSVYGLVAGLIFPIVLALMLNYIGNTRFKKVVQTITYAPYFISTTVMVSIILQFLAREYGPINSFLKSMGLQQIDFLSNAKIFPHVYVWSGIWQYTGYNSIIYIATLSGIDVELHEAAIVDGATKWRRIWSIDLPGIRPTIVILLIMNMGSILSTGFEKIYLMQNNLNLSASEVIDTYVYKIGLASPIANYSYPTAIGLFQSFIGMLLIIAANALARRVSESSLW
ncbi:MAG: ABC transporter permease [Christensenellales bacterium]|jgi:putative aldouronate transport system permease protein